MYGDQLGLILWLVQRTHFIVYNNDQIYIYFTDRIKSILNFSF
jgi:hypothetical protein